MSAIKSLLAHFGYYKLDHKQDLSKINKVEFSKVSFQLDKSNETNLFNSSVLNNLVSESDSNASQFQFHYSGNLLQQNIFQTNSTDPKINYKNPYELAEAAKFVEITHMKTRVNQNPNSGYYMVVDDFNLHSSGNKLNTISDIKRERLLKTYSPEKYKLSGRLVNLINK